MPRGPMGRLLSVLAPWVWRRLELAWDTPIEQLHLTPGSDASSGMMVSWATPSAVADPFVEHAGHRVMADTITYDGTSAFFHHAFLDGLAADSEHAYVVGHAGRIVSQPSMFRTAPAGSGRVVLTACGDLGVHGAAVGRPGTVNAARTVDLVGSLRPTVHLVAGDLSYAVGDQRTWDRWFNMIAPVARKVPWVPTLGNHEVELPAAIGGFGTDGRAWGRWGYAAYRHRFRLPDNGVTRLQGCFHTTRIGPVQVVALDANDVTAEPGANRGYTQGRQDRWLRDVLHRAAADESVGAIIVLLHQPAWSSADLHGSDMGVRDAWHRLFVEAGVRLVLQAHDHVYERTHPLDAAGDATDPGHGVVYITCGNGGQTLRSFKGRRPSWSAAREDHHVGVVRVSAEPGTDGLTLDVTALDLAGEIRDRVVIPPRVGTPVTEPVAAGADGPGLAALAGAGLLPLRARSHRDDPRVCTESEEPSDG